MSIEFEEGYDSFHSRNADDSPYDEGSFKWHEWQEGWVTAEDDWNRRL